MKVRESLYEVKTPSMTPSAIRSRNAREYARNHQEETEQLKYYRDEKRTQKRRAMAEKWIQNDENVYYRGQADNALLRNILSKYDLWDYVTGNFIEISAQHNTKSEYHGSVESTNVTAEGYITISSPRNAEKKINIDKEFSKEYVSSYGYDHHYYDY